MHIRMMVALPITIITYKQYCSFILHIMKISIIIASILSLYSISFLMYGNASLTAYAQSNLQTIKSRDLVLDLGNGLKTNA
jgi:hypothetical protein